MFSGTSRQPSNVYGDASVRPEEGAGGEEEGGEKEGV